MRQTENNIGAPGPGIVEAAEGLIHRLWIEWSPEVNITVTSISVIDWPDEILQDIAQNAHDAIEGGADRVDIVHLGKTIEQVSRLSTIADRPPVWDLEHAAEQIRQDAARRRFELAKLSAASSLPHATTEEAKKLLERLLVEAPGKKGDTTNLRKLVSDTISGKRRNIHTPWETLNNFSQALLPGTVTLLCGGPGSGKTFFLIQLINWFFNQKVPFGYYALEEDKTFVLLRLLAQMSRCSSILNSDWVREYPQEADRYLNIFEPRLRDIGKFLYSAPGAKVMLSDLPKWIESRAKRKDRIIIIDPASVANFGQHIADTVQDFMERTKDIARIHETSVIIALHPNTESLSTGRVGMGGLKGGSTWDNLTQTALWLEIAQYGNQESVETKHGVHPLSFNRRLWMLKTRNGKGQGSRLAFQFDPDTLTFDEIGIIVKPSKKQKQTEQPQDTGYDENDTF